MSLVSGEKQSPLRKLKSAPLSRASSAIAPTRYQPADAERRAVAARSSPSPTPDIRIPTRPAAVIACPYPAEAPMTSTVGASRPSSPTPVTSSATVARAAGRVRVQQQGALALSLHHTHRHTATIPVTVQPDRAVPARDRG